MENKNIWLTYHQAMIFMYRLDQMKKSNPYFNDEISKGFEDYVIERAGEIVLTYPQIKLKIIPNANKYCITQSMFNYLSELTGINPLDKEIIEEYIPVINKIGENASSKLEENFKRR